MKEQQSFLKDQLRQETERKKELKLELEKDHQRIVALERQLREKRRAGRRKSLEGLEGGTSKFDFLLLFFLVFSIIYRS